MQRRNTIFVLVCVALGLIALSGAARADGRVNIGRGSELIWRLPLEEKLKAKLSVNFQDEPLEDAVAFLREVLEVNIVISPRVRDLDPKFITLTLDDLDGERVLEWMMTLTGLKYGYYHGAILISTPEHVRQAETKFFRIYDVRDITASNARGRRARRRDDGDGLADGDDDGARTGGGADLAEIIVTQTGPENWERVTVLGGDEENDNREREY